MALLQELQGTAVQADCQVGGFEHALGNGEAKKYTLW
jgi:hypothetical protein